MAFGLVGDHHQPWSGRIGSGSVPLIRSLVRVRSARSWRDRVTGPEVLNRPAAALLMGWNPHYTQPHPKLTYLDIQPHPTQLVNFSTLTNPPHYKQVTHTIHRNLVILHLKWGPHIYLVTLLCTEYMSIILTHL